MAMKACKCGSGNGNTGFPSCVPQPGITSTLFLMYQVANDGTRNQIDCDSDTVNSAFVTGKINESDVSKRWVPIVNFENVTDERADAVLQTLDSGVTRFLRQGPRTFSGFIFDGASPELARQINKGRCNKNAVYYVDEEGQLVGAKDSTDANKINPVKITTFYAEYVKKTNDSDAAVVINFTVDKREDDGDLRVLIPGEGVANDVDLNDVDGLLEPCAEVVAGTITTTEVQIDYYLPFGDFCAPQPVEGLVLADIALFNVTDNAAVTPLTVTESATVAGRYTITYTAQDASDVLYSDITKSGYDGDKVKEVTYTTP